MMSFHTYCGRYVPYSGWDIAISINNDIRDLHEHKYQDAPANGTIKIMTAERPQVSAYRTKPQRHVENHALTFTTLLSTKSYAVRRVLPRFDTQSVNLYSKSNHPYTIKLAVANEYTVTLYIQNSTQHTSIIIGISRLTSRHMKPTGDGRET